MADQFFTVYRPLERRAAATGVRLVLVSSESAILRVGMQTAEASGYSAAKQSNAGNLPGFVAILPHWRKVALELNKNTKIQDTEYDYDSLGKVCAPLALLVRQLDEFFVGKRTRIDVKFELHASDFQRKVLEKLGDIAPYGTKKSYKDIADALGMESTSGDDYKCFRAVGMALSRNPLPIVVPCHRIVPAAAVQKESGGVGGYVGGPEFKQVLLDIEREAAGNPAAAAAGGGGGGGGAVPCKYGDSCYNTGSDHRQKYYHNESRNGVTGSGDAFSTSGGDATSGGGDDEVLTEQQQQQQQPPESDAGVAAPAAQPPASNHAKKRTRCKYGAACYNVKDAHRSKYLHDDEALAKTVDGPIVHKPNHALKVSLSCRWGSHRLLTVGGGSSILGRGDFLGIDDKRCSRKQAELDVDEETRVVSLTTFGVNPTLVVRRKQNYYVVKDSSMDLQDMDRVVFVNDYPMQVTIEGGVPARQPPPEVIVEAVEEDAAAPPAAKKAKVACKYGAKCHNDSAEHQQKYSHA